mgnify:CR=1 FL=1
MTDREAISIHSPRMGRDLYTVLGIENVPYDFNPLSPHGERHIERGYITQDEYISIHSPRMGRDGPSRGGGAAAGISIHSPRMGRDG